MKSISKTLEAIRKICLFFAILSTVLLFAVVAFNIIGRAIFDASGGDVNLMIFGAIELSQYALMVSVFTAIPAMLGTGLIKVDILSKQFPPWLQKTADRFWFLLIAIFAAILTYSFFEFAQTSIERGDQTQDLRWPLWPFYGAATLGCAALTLLAGGAALGVVEPLDESNS